MVSELNEERGDEPGKSGLLSESIRKAVLAGFSALFMTEEGIRGALSDMRLPKDALSYVVQQAERTRRELFRSVTEEIKGFLKNIDLSGEVRKAMTGLKVEVKAEIRFTDESHIETDVSTEVTDAPASPRLGRRSSRAKRSP